ncbi:uncharacterized protein LOC123528178 [Mercenaria mercenaria]|uniref:uncharacterized protein LOC123528178 n=1 Tax=Mercenaria mercenaria TaxID=6596 RepID=UPI00234E8257|nr:uncharacterized protein LOC123528178 [Mercenaria mercenaria]
MQRCFDVGMSYEAVKMGRWSKADHRGLKPTLVTKALHHDDLILTVYSAFAKACSNHNNQLNNEPSLEADGSFFIRNGILFATTFAKQLKDFTSLGREVQHEQIKTAVIEMSVMFEEVRLKTAGSEDCTIYTRKTENSVITVMRNKGKKLTQKLMSLNLTQAELSLLLAVILFCSDRHCSDTADCKKLEWLEESLLSALKYQLVLNHTKHLGFLPQIIEFICCLRGLTIQYLDDILRFK